MRRPLLLAVITLASCVSEETVERRWTAYVEEHNSCETPDDCVIIYPGCPLGCWEAVAAEYETEAQEKAEKLIKQYERGGRACAYGCVSPGPLVCEQNRCTIGEPGPCADLDCGSPCTNCTGNNCPAVEEYCQPDGTCSSEQPMCG